MVGRFIVKKPYGKQARYYIIENDDFRTSPYYSMKRAKEVALIHKMEGNNIMIVKAVGVVSSKGKLSKVI
jgi:hypothetical protein